MSSLVADLFIWALLFFGLLFCGFGLMGLLIFPDTKSRMFTALRATSIGLGAFALAVIIYGYTMSLARGSDLYLTLIFHTLVLVSVLAAGTWAMYGIIRKRTNGERSGDTGQLPAEPEAGSKDGE